MKHRTLAIAVALLASQAAIAAGPVAYGQDRAAPLVLRLSTDGSWLGVMRVDGSNGGSPELFIAPVLPAPRGAAGSPLTIGGLFSVPLGEAGQIVVSAEQSWSPAQSGFAVPSSWCQGLVGLVANTHDCLVAGSLATAAQPSTIRRQGTLGWVGNNLEFALNYGGSSAQALAGYPRAPAAAQLLLSPLQSSFAGLPGTVESRDLSFSSMWRLAPWGGVELTAGLSESSLAPSGRRPALPPPRCTAPAARVRWR